MTKICSNPSCGCIVQGKFCHKCGFKAISKSPSYTVYCKGLLEDGCPCNSEIIANHKFCDNCGTPVATIITPTDSKHAETNLCYALSSDVECTDDAEESNARCQPCSVKNKSTVATLFCDTCNEFQCSDCSQVHTVYLFMKSHVLVSAKAAKNKLPVIDLNGIDHCTEHNKALEFYCKTENQMCCSICAIGSHRKCEDVTAIDLLPVEEMDKTSRVINKKLDELKEKKSSTTNYLESETVNIQSQSDQLKKTLDSMQVKIVENYSNFAKDTIQQMSTVRGKKLVELNQTRLEFEKLNASLNKEVELYQNVERNGTSVQKFIIQHKLQELINDNFKQTCKLASSHVTTNIVLEFKDPVNILARSEKEFGSLRVVESRSGENNQAAIETSSEEEAVKYIVEYGAVPEPMQLGIVAEHLKSEADQEWQLSGESDEHLYEKICSKPQYAIPIQKPYEVPEVTRVETNPIYQEVKSANIFKQAGKVPIHIKPEECLPKSEAYRNFRQSKYRTYLPEDEPDKLLQQPLFWKKAPTAQEISFPKSEPTYVQQDIEDLSISDIEPRTVQSYAGQEFGAYPQYPLYPEIKYPHSTYN